MIVDITKKILIVGLGLLGGSYARVLKRFGFTISAITLEEKDIELSYSGFMAPAREAEKGKWLCPQLKNTPPPSYPEGFFMYKKLF